MGSRTPRTSAAVIAGGGGAAPDPHKASHEDGGADEINVAGLSGELADPQPPKAHATDHQHSGSDEVATATPGANAIPKAEGDGKLNGGWIDPADIDHDTLLNYLIAQHRIINDAGDSTTELLSSNKINSLTTALAEGKVIKASVDTSTEGEGNITLSGEQTLNGLLTSASRVLVIEQSTVADNGIYVSAAGAWARAADADTDAEVANGNITHVLNSGSTKNLFKYILVTADPITVGVTDQDWEEHKNIEIGTTGGTAAEGNDSRILTQDENDGIGAAAAAVTAGNPVVEDSDSRLTDSRTPTVHKDSHKSGGSDPFAAADILEATVKRIQTTTGPTTLLVGAMADGEFLKRDGTGLIGATPSGDPANSIVEATGQITTTSTSLITATSMSITPASGTYFVWFNCEVDNVTTDGGVTIGIAKDTTDDASSRKSYKVGADTSGQASENISTMAKVTVNGSEAINGRWARETAIGTARMRERQLFIMKVA